VLYGEKKNRIIYKPSKKPIQDLFILVALYSDSILGRLPYEVCKHGMEEQISSGET